MMVSRRLDSLQTGSAGSKRCLQALPRFSPTEARVIAGLQKCTIGICGLSCKQRLEREIHGEIMPDCKGDLDCSERMASQILEIVVDSHPFNPESFRRDRGELLVQLVTGAT
jgi:hypothetical protein